MERRKYGLLLLFITSLTSALYFPQSDLTLRIPYISKDDANLKLINLRTLRNDSTSPSNVKYQILNNKKEYATLNAKSKDVTLHTIAKPGTPNAILIQASESGSTSSENAILEIKIHSEAVKDGRFNCTSYLQDMCFWNVSKYRIYENQAETFLGTFGPDVYRTLCPKFIVTSYELLNGTNFFYSVKNKIYSNESLDRDSLNPPKGTGSRVYLNARCIIYDEETGIQYTMEKLLNVDVLDENDNPPVAQMNQNVDIHLKDFTLGDRLDDNDLVFKDADDISSNSYSVGILGDIYNALNFTYDIITIEHPKKPEIPSSTAILARIYSRTTLLPKSPYSVVLQVKDERLLAGYGDNTINVTLSFVGPQHHTTTTTTAIPLNQQITYPRITRISKNSNHYYRVAQPSFDVNSKIIFNLSGSDAFNITKTAGIIFVSNTGALKNILSLVRLKVQWRLPDRRLGSTTVTVEVFESSDLCIQSQTAEHSCANAKSRAECEARCGIGTGVTSETSQDYAGECIWRSNRVNNATISERYETCSPDLNFCPNYVCDELEHLDPRICPQDCVIESELHFGNVNKEGRGIHSGFGTCWCDDMMQCTCGKFRPKNIGTNAIMKDSADFTKPPKKEQIDNKEVVVTNARVLASTCGPFCVMGILGALIFGFITMVSSLVMWKCRLGKKHLRRSKNRVNDPSNELAISPSDYVDRGDGLLMGLDPLSMANCSLLSPKTPPDPKWEFNRSRLTIEQILGEGEFGRVLRATAQDIGGWPGPTTVAVKTLKEDASASELADLLSEYELLKEAHHPNVIRLLGACTTNGGPIYLIIEFAEFGSLRNYLRRSRHLDSEGRVPCTTALLPNNHQIDNDLIPHNNYAITARDILSFAWQISKGMAYLADIKLVHRDLAARNVLLATGKVCKISDFGLTRDVYEDDAYLKRSKGRVPVKWMAPESLADHVYTSKSDVWSFGILLWELITLGASPYPGVDVHNLYNLLKSGYRMEKPYNCSPQLYKLMVSCWHDEAGMRPSFKELVLQWERMLEDGIEYLDLNPRTVHNQTYFADLHALDSPASSADTNNSFNFSTNPVWNGAVNYLSKPFEQNMSKSDKVDKLHALWKEPNNVSYVNDELVVAASSISHYESPIRFRNVSVVSNSENDLTEIIENSSSTVNNNVKNNANNYRPHSYIDMQGNNSKGKEQTIMQQDLLLSFSAESEA